MADFGKWTQNKAEIQMLGEIPLCRDEEDFQEILGMGDRHWDTSWFIFSISQTSQTRKREGLLSLNPTGMAAAVWQGWAGNVCEPSGSGRHRPSPWRAGNVNELLINPELLSHPHPALVHSHSLGQDVLAASRPPKKKKNGKNCEQGKICWNF